MSTSQTNGEPLGARLKRLRIAADLNKAQLARMVGVSDVSISYWESGEIEQIGHLRLLALADALEVTVSELLGDPRLARREALKQVEVLEKAKASCEHIAKGQEKLAWMHSETLADGEEVIGEQGIPYSNKALGAAHCADEIGRLATKLRRQAEASDQAERTPNSGL